MYQLVKVLKTNCLAKLGSWKPFSTCTAPLSAHTNSGELTSSLKLHAKVKERNTQELIFTLQKASLSIQIQIKLWINCKICLLKWSMQPSCKLMLMENSHYKANGTLST